MTVAIEPTDPRISFIGAVSTADQKELAAILATTRVIITAEQPILTTATGQIVVYQLSTLAMRLFDRVELEGDEAVPTSPALPPLGGPFLAAVRHTCATLRPTTPEPPVATIRIRVGDGPADAMLYVGATAWSALLSPAAPQPITSSPTPVGALAAGTLAAAELFKLAFAGRVVPAVVGHGYALSLLKYAASVGDVPLPAPSLSLDVVLYGAGSIGTGFAHALALAPQFAGRLVVVDNGVFDGKNPYKYSLLDWETACAGPYKAPWLARRLRQLSAGRLRATGMVGTAEEYVASLPHDYHIPLAVAAVDTYEARLEIQDTLPQRILNAGIAGTTAEVSVHGFGDGPCLCCLCLDAELESWQAGPIANAVGLDAGRAHELIRGNLPMKWEDLDHIRAAGRLPAAVFATLDSFLGQPLLSLWNRAAYSEAAMRASTPGGVPLVSTAFVSAFAGVLLLAELYKAADPALAAYAVDNSYRHDLLGVPAENVFRYERDPRGWCLCHSGFRLDFYVEKYGS